VKIDHEEITYMMKIFRDGTEDASTFSEKDGLNDESTKGMTVFSNEVTNLEKKSF
jgi:hypothetical protein